VTCGKAVNGRTGLDLRKRVFSIDGKTQGVFIVFDEKTLSLQKRNGFFDYFIQNCFELNYCGLGTGAKDIGIFIGRELIDSIDIESVKM